MLLRWVLPLKTKNAINLVLTRNLNFTKIIFLKPKLKTISLH